MALFDKLKKKTEERNDASAVLPIGKKQLEEAAKNLRDYKEGKANLEKRIIEDDKWYKLRHWECISSNPNEVKPVSAWLFNSIANKHADAMDNFPSANILPREKGDEPQSKMLSSIIPVVLDQAEFEQTYSDMWYDKLKGGTGIYGVYWDVTALNGLGDIAIKNVDILSIFWEPGITDIQRSKNIFTVELMDNDVIEQRYPQAHGHLGNGVIEVKEYAHDDSIKTINKSCVVDWYYKRNVNGKTILHYVKFVNDVVLYASENIPEMAERGFYDHGQYPFVFDALYNVPGSPAGFGFVDIGKSAQEYIDRGKQAIMKNLLANASPRYFVGAGGKVNEKEFADLSNELVHVEGNVDDNNIRPIQFNTLSGNFLEVINGNIEELKETTSNRDVSNGGTTSGVTAASAIAALQEAGSKISRDIIKASYRQYRKVISLVIELIRQFYSAPRSFRIIGEHGATQYVTFSNSEIIPITQGNTFGEDMGIKLPIFDIEITVERASAYSRLAHNELLVQLWGMGVFNPQMADQSMMLLESMDFDGKEKIMEMVSRTGGMLQQMMMLAQMLDKAVPTKQGQPGFAESIAIQYGMQMPTTTKAEMPNTETEAATTRKAREQTAEATVPR